ncbi:MAG TPA: protein translocase subunit SecD [Actinomycetota bacterium]|nr:protein translocase subunit SecD [Actinomycetota bacterium]
MKRSRGLWVSVIVMGLLISLSVAAFAADRLQPVLGLDLQGGVSVILSAPEGTDDSTMQTALENIRNRVDAFGVGEPDIALSGTTIEIQIPGLTDSTVEERPSDLYCIADPKGATYGCAADEATPTTALPGFGVTSQESKVCVVAGDVELKCYESQAAADAAKAGITTEPKVSASASASASTAPPVSASPTPTSGPGSTSGEHCLTDFAKNELQCYPDFATAQAAFKSLDTEVTETTWCISAPAPKAESSPTPSSSSSPEPTKDPGTAYAALDQAGSSSLPCDYKSEPEATTALGDLSVEHLTTRYCVVSAQGEDLGCYTTQAAAAERQRETGQQRLLDLIGKTARLEERQTLEIVSPGDPRYASVQFTCQTPEEQDSKTCQLDAQDDNEVWYPDADGNAVHLGPIVITGANITEARASLTGSSQSLAEWTVAFELDGEGSDAFAEATTVAFNSPSPQNQIAIAVDRQIISNPVVNSPITAGRGEITGSFTEQGAKDLASILNAGALPVDLTRESVQTVSPTLGSDSLREGIVAGAAGLFLLFMYLLFYYRLLGVVAWFGMAIWAVLAITLISLAGESFGYALTLAGVAGLVISLGVTADSYIVFFERLKDEVRSGRSPRTAVQPAFQRAFKTIVAADIVTGIAAAVLYFTAVSSVRGFALTLGVATALDLFVVYFFKRPTVFLIARSKRLSEVRGFGLASATGADHIDAPEARP